MTLAVVSNILTMIFCIAVLVQSVRLMRAFDAVKGGALTDVVSALNVSTGEARRVLGSLTDLLRGDVAITARTISEGKAMIEELAVMTGIANAIAERIIDAAGSSNRPLLTSRMAKIAGSPPASDKESTADANIAGQKPKTARRPRRSKQAASEVAA